MSDIGLSLYLKEQPIYGSSRLGVLQLEELLSVDLREEVVEPIAASSERYGRSMGQRRYELPDHLGNVHVTVSGCKQGKGVVAEQMLYLPELHSSVITILSAIRCLSEEKFPSLTAMGLTDRRRTTRCMGKGRAIRQSSGNTIQDWVGDGMWIRGRIPLLVLVLRLIIIPFGSVIGWGILSGLPKKDLMKLI